MGLAKLLSGFILLLIGVNLIAVIGTSVAGNIQLSDSGDEVLAIASSLGQTANDDVVDLTYFGNKTVNTTTNARASDVNFTRAGVVTVNGTAWNDGGTYNVTYSFEADLYVADSRARSIMPLITIFFALGILAIAVMVGVDGFKGMGFLN